MGMCMAAAGTITDHGVKLLRGPSALLCPRSALAVLSGTVSRLAAGPGLPTEAAGPLATLSAQRWESFLSS